jgi:hypothetical protein
MASERKLQSLEHAIDLAEAVKYSPRKALHSKSGAMAAIVVAPGRPA